MHRNFHPPHGPPAGQENPMKDAASSAKPRKIQRKGLPEPRVESPYEEAYPTFSTRIPRALYDRAKNLKAVTGKSFANILEESLDRQEAATDAAYARGPAAAVEKFAVPYRCCMC